MRFEQLLQWAWDWPTIETNALLACGEHPRLLAVQLSRWVRAGRLVPLRRGLYLLAPPYRRVEPPLAYLANLIVRPSYVSLE